MKYKLIKGESSNELIIFFSGWGTDYNILNEGSLQNQHCDICIVWDYSDKNIDDTFLNNYKTIKVAAWSLGVWCASDYLKHKNLNIVSSLAINGTLLSINDEYGIPKAIYEGTYNTLSEESILKFYRRMCGSKSLTELFIANHKPARDINSLKTELNEISIRFNNSIPSDLFKWDKVIITKKDNIFHSQNQSLFWSEYADKHNCSLIELDGAHYFEALSDINELIKFLNNTY